MNGANDRGVKPDQPSGAAIDRKLFWVFPSERIWMLFGLVLGYLLPVEHWFGIDLKIWVFVVAAIMSLELIVAGKLLRAEFQKTPLEGWSISVIVKMTHTESAARRTKVVGNVAAALIAKVMVLGGLMLGQVASIYFGR